MSAPGLHADTRYCEDCEIVVTLWETYGSGMEVIARKVAEILDLPVYANAFTGAELRAKLEPAGFVAVQATGMKPGSFGRPGVLTKLKEYNKEAARERREKVNRMASGGAVIMGHNATAILQERPNTLHVKLDGPEHIRLQRAVDLYGITEKKAKEELEFEDLVRTQISREVFGWNPLDDDLFDMVLNTTRLDLDSCARVIAAAAKALKAQE